MAGRSYGPGTDVVALQSSLRKIGGTATPCLRHWVQVDPVALPFRVVRFVRFDVTLPDPIVFLTAHLTHCLGSLEV